MSDTLPEIAAGSLLHDGYPLSTANTVGVVDWQRLKSTIIRRLAAAADAEASILSATLTGSFLESTTPTAISDIDFVVVVEHLNAAVYQRLIDVFSDALEPALHASGYRLRINATLGPLKLNDPDTAVLHLMLYSRSAHVDHAISSPFTCLDWQRSETYAKRSLAEVFPVFGLQPRHFLSARRSLKDYLGDFDAGAVSFRELVCSADGYREEKRSKPMTRRDRHEFAYHILRFLMQNLLKLVRRDNAALATEPLLGAYFALFPARRREVSVFFRALQAGKLAGEFSLADAELDCELRAFVDGFERQFREMFFEQATRHLVFRHARTELNRDARGERLFLGASDPPVAAADDYRLLARAAAEMKPVTAFASPLLRCRQTLAAATEGLAPISVDCDPRLREINYGHFEGLSIAQARGSHGAIFAAWERGEDPRFPGGGENTQDVLDRALAFADQCWRPASGSTVTCTHNVVLRTLVGHTLGMPSRLWNRLEIPHLGPITFIATRDHGLFVDIDPEVSRELFQRFIAEEGCVECKS